VPISEAARPMTKSVWIYDASRLFNFEHHVAAG
jgi:hypothetical protein